MKTSPMMGRKVCKINMVRFLILWHSNKQAKASYSFSIR